MLIIPDVNRFSIMSTSPIKRDTSEPGSNPFNSSAVRDMNFSIRRLLIACVIFCPKTVRSPSLADSVSPVKKSIAKYAITIPSPGICPAVNISMIFPRINGGISENMTARHTAATIPNDKSLYCKIVSVIIFFTYFGFFPEFAAFSFSLFFTSTASILSIVKQRIFTALFNKLIMASELCFSVIKP